jgi:hypothetical protein
VLPLRATVLPIAGLSPWDRSELFWMALKTANNARAAISLKSLKY